MNSTHEDNWLILIKASLLSVIGTNVLIEMKSWLLTTIEAVATMVVVTAVLFVFKKVLNYYWEKYFSKYFR